MCVFESPTYSIRNKELEYLKQWINGLMAEQNSCTSVFTGHFFPFLHYKVHTLYECHVSMFACKPMYNLVPF